MADWSTNTYPTQKWQAFTKLADDEHSRFSWQKLKTSSPDKHILATLSTASSITLRDSQGKVIRTIDTQSRENGDSDFRAMGFSPDGQTITLVNRNNPGEGDLFLNWEAYNIQNGLAEFPLSTRYDTAQGPPMLSELFLALEPLGWMDDGKALAFNYWEDSAYLPYEQTDRGAFSRYWHSQNNIPYMIFPVIWAKQSTPSWFLDVINQLIHIKQDELKGQELVAPSSSSFQTLLEETIHIHQDETNNYE